MTDAVAIARTFAEALALPEAERRAFLAAVAASDRDTAREVDELLEVHGELARRDHDLGIVGGDVVATRKLRETALGPGVVVGRYRIEGLIGSGTSAEVFGAVAEGPGPARVAIKVLRAGALSRDALARFEDERDLIAGLDHPGIAPILDAGSLPDGRPWFAMPRIEGTTLVAWCAERAATLDQRLALVAETARAVGFAHRRGIVHRDLSAGNVLVRTVDGRAVPVVVDFGVAKAQHAARRVQSEVLVHRRILGTPAYMAPEQTRPAAPVGPPADVFALGSLLTELLTGRTPLDPAWLAGLGLDELFRAVRETERPSLTGVWRSLPDDDRRRQLSSCGVGPRSLERLLRGETGWVAAKALALDPDRRYSTADTLADDLDRLRRSEPLEARPATTGYLLRRFVARRKGLVIAAAAVGLAIAIGAAATWRQSRRLEARNADLAALAQQLAGDLARSIEGIPDSAPLRRELLTRSVESLRRLAEQQPEDRTLQRILAEGIVDLARVAGDPRISNTGDPAFAAEAFGQAIAIWERDPMLESDPALGRALAQARLARGAALVRLGEWAAAAGEFGEAQRRCERLLATDTRDTTLRSRIAYAFLMRLRQLEDRGPLRAEIERIEGLLNAEPLPADAGLTDLFLHADSFASLGAAAIELEDPDRADRLYRINETLIADMAGRLADPAELDHVRHRQADAGRYRARIAALRGDGPAEIEAFRTSLALFEALLAEHPDRLPVRHAICLTTAEWAQAGFRLGDPSLDEATARAVRAAEDFLTCDPTNAVARDAVGRALLLRIRWLREAPSDPDRAAELAEAEERFAAIAAAAEAARAGESVR